MSRDSRYKILEVHLATKTVNQRADPTQIYKMLKKEVLISFMELQDAKDWLIKEMEEEAKSYEMNLAMCGGDSEMMPNQGTDEHYIFDTVTSKTFQLMFTGDRHDIVETDPIEKQYSGDWQM